MHRSRPGGFRSHDYDPLHLGLLRLGQSHAHLVEAVDAVETSRGFQPPIFVDIRIRRSVRAAGFTGPAFEKLLGELIDIVDEIAREQVHRDRHRPASRSPIPWRLRNFWTSPSIGSAQATPLVLL